MPLTEQERQKLTALRSISAPRVAAPSQAAPNEIRRRSALSGPMARFGAGAIGTGAGAWLGGQAGAAAGAVFPPAIPFITAAGALIGAGAGTLAAQQARRMGAAALEYDAPQGRAGAIDRSLQQAPWDVVEGVGSELGGRAIGAAARKFGPTLKSGYLQARELMTGVHEAPGIGPSTRVLKRGTQIIKPEYRSGAPESVTGKVQRGVTKFLEDARTAWKKATTTLDPKLAGRYTNQSEPFQAFRQALVDAKIISPSGKAERTFFPTTVAKGSAQASTRLRTVLAKLNRVTKRGGYITAAEAQKAIREIDDIVSYGKKGVNPIGDQEEALLKGLRRSMMERVGKDVPQLAKRNAAYSEALDLYENVQPKVTEPSVANTVKGLATRSNEFPFPQLKKINAKLPRGYKFMDTVEDYLGGRAFANAKGIGRLGALLTLGGAGFGGILGHPLAGATTLGTMGAMASPALYARELGMWRAAAPFMRKAGPHIERGIAPLLSGVTGTFRDE